MSTPRGIEHIGTPPRSRPLGDVNTDDTYADHVAGDGSRIARASAVARLVANIRSSTEVCDRKFAGFIARDTGRRNGSGPGSGRPGATV